MGWHAQAVSRVHPIKAWGCSHATILPRANHATMTVGAFHVRTCLPGPQLFCGAKLSGKAAAHPRVMADVETSLHIAWTFFLSAAHLHLCSAQHACRLNPMSWAPKTYIWKTTQHCEEARTCLQPLQEQLRHHTASWRPRTRHKSVFYGMPYELHNVGGTQLACAGTALLRWAQSVRGRIASRLDEVELSHHIEKRINCKGATNIVRVARVSGEGGTNSCRTPTRASFACRARRAAGTRGQGMAIEWSDVTALLGSAPSILQAGSGGMRGF